jgi:hypothetical protein
MTEIQLFRKIRSDMSAKLAHLLGPGKARDPTQDSDKEN